MAINLVWTRDERDESLHFQPIERLKVYLFGATILFASFGMGEAVYRLLFSEFDGVTDRIPIEVLFGLVFAWLATKFVGGVYRDRKERSVRLTFILGAEALWKESLRWRIQRKPTIDQSNPRGSR